jgi:hypothetical protein
MKNRNMVRAALLMILGLGFISAARADNITLASVGTATDAGQTNSNGATVAISANSLWAAALPGSSWVSFGPTGSSAAPGFFVVPNGTVVSFFDAFNVPGTPTGGSISVMADDSAAVFLNGVLLQSEAASSGNTYATCSDFGIGCLVSMTVNLPASDLKAGSNTLEFRVAQRDAGSFGLDYAGSVTDPASSVPEPGLALLMMVGLITVGGASFIRKTGRPFEHKVPMNKDDDIPASFFTASRIDGAPSSELDEFEMRRRAFFS